MDTLQYRVLIINEHDPKHEPERRARSRHWTWEIIGPKGSIAQGAVSSEYLAYTCSSLALMKLAGDPTY